MDNNPLYLFTNIVLIDEFTQGEPKIDMLFLFFILPLFPSSVPFQATC